ncbi:MAG: diguanylate cyclase [Candidatus Omnitrophica bacterium]|nr:diguanylate cyclase [Candidatus Omnitrophota bacterium]
MNKLFSSSLWKAAFVAVAASLLYLILLEPFSLLEIPKLKTQDLFFRARYVLAPSHPIWNQFFLIIIDDESIKRVHERWPFQRRTYAQLLEKITASNPRLVGFDFIFSGKGEPADDFLLAQALERSGKTVLASVIDTEGNHIRPLSEFAVAAQSFGVVNKLLDRDLYVRRASLIYRDEQGNRISWPWEVEMAISLLGLERAEYQITPSGIQFEAGRFSIPFYNSKREWQKINYRLNLKDIDHTPLWQALESKDLGSQLEGKIVLIGTTSRILHDDYHTPLGLMPGVIVNLNWLENLLARDFLKRIPTVFNILFVFLFVAFAAYLSLRENVLRGFVILVLITAGFLGGFFILFWKNYVGDYLTPFLGGWAFFTGITFYRYFHTFLENIQLKGKVITDPLTGLYNRRFLESQIDTELQKIADIKGLRRTDALHELSILMIDIDDFKKINDIYGHQFGDDVLKNISFSIKESTRKDDFVSRFGGEEFCVVLPHTSKEEAKQIAEKVRSNIQAKKFNYVNKITSFTVSIGLASAKADHLLASRSLIRSADEALYKAKKTGKNKVSLYQRESI